MAKVTPGFKLYLYQLLSREMGIGKQTLLPQVEEMLAADDILPQDLECDTIQELVQACPDFLKLTVFKKGRAYATVLRNEEWDRMLAEPQDKEPASKQPAGGPKTWKKKKGARKSLKPVKPGKQRRDREAREAAEREAALRAEEERLAAAAQEAQAEAEEVVAAPVEQEQAEQPEPSAPAESLSAQSETEAPSSSPVARTIAEILEEARQAEAAAQEAQAAADAAAPVGDDQPAAPAEEQVPPERPQTPAAPNEAPEPAQPQDLETESSRPQQKPLAPMAPAPAPISLTITYNPYEDMDLELEQQAAEATRTETARGGSPTNGPSARGPRPTAGAPAPSPAPTSAPAAQPSAVTIPLEGLPEDFALDVSCGDALLRMLYQLLPYDVEPMAVLDVDWRVARATGSLSGTRSRVSFPLRYQHEDGSPIEITLRRSARNASGRRWSLALVDGDDGSGITHNSLGFEGLPAADEGAWADLSGAGTDAAANPMRELAQQVVIGTWDTFLGSLATMAAPERWNYPGEGVGKASRYGVLREYIALTYHRACIQGRVATSADGSFAAFCTNLLTPFGQDIYACMTARKGDIPWQFRGFAVAGSGELGARLSGTLAELPAAPTYLETLSDVTPEQGRMYVLDTDTILGTQLGRLPHAFLAEHLEGNFAAEALLSAGSGLTSAELRDLARIIRSDASAYRRLRRTLDDAVDQALLRVRASYRDAVPAYDPTDDRTKLLLPLCLVEDAHVDCALVLDLQPSGAYRAASVLALPRAYACARVISREQPGWLAADKVLG